MSEWRVRVIPAMVDFVPSPEAELAAVALASAFNFPGAQCTAHREVSFIDGGENFPKSMPCTHCGFDLRLNASWGDAMDSAFALSPQFSDLRFRCPSCADVLSLHEISLRDNTHGFARWVLEWPMTVDGLVSADQLEELGFAIGCESHVIYVHI